MYIKLSELPQTSKLMDEFISTNKLIKKAKKEGVSFGSGNPYNRLRYYTKIGWVPHMIRKAVKGGSIVGHYPSWTLGRLSYIEELKSKGLSNEEVTKKINLKNKVINVKNAITSPEAQKRVTVYITLFVVMFILGTELGIIKLGTPKIQLTKVSNVTNQVQLLNDGVAFIPRNQTKVFVKNSKITKNSKVYVTFIQNYSPASRFWVSQIDEGQGFLVELDAPVYENIEFNWWVSK